jgi:hypothetical protein
LPPRRLVFAALPDPARAVPVSETGIIDYLQAVMTGAAHR